MKKLLDSYAALPRYMLGIGGDGQPIPPPQKDPSWDGRMVQWNSTAVWSDESNLQTLRALLAVSLEMLDVMPASGDTVSEEYVNQLNLIHKALAHVTRHFPRVACWVMYHIDDRGSSFEPSPIFGFFDPDQAMQVAEMWQAYHDSHDWWAPTQWYVGWGAVEMHMVIDPRYKKLGTLRPGF